MENIEFESFDNIENDDSGRLYEMGKNYYKINLEQFIKENQILNWQSTITNRL